MLLLYHNGLKLRIIFIFHLHSTMLLLYPLCGLSIFITTFIYIPLCFYFIAFFALLSSMLDTYLHSTMLLLYRVSPLKPTPEPLFTFHYASTLSLFHLLTSYLLSNLHSTMLLLYRAYPAERPLPERIYIPLCFYFIRKRAPGCNNTDIIYIPLCFYFIYLRKSTIDHVKKNLHSTMLLLYPVPLFPFYFLQYGDTFCLPPFCIALL